MKKIFCFILCGAFIFLMLSNIVVENKPSNIEDQVIRFHILANSDSEQDQTLKLEVRDEVLKYMDPRLKNSKSIEESKKILQENNEKVKAIALNVIKEKGYNYTVKSGMVNENFPVKSYGDLIFPAGKYEAYKIIIGNGNGHNWWCVMFPPLCFVDITHGETSNKENETLVKNMLKNNKKNNYVIKFKIVELIKKIF